MELRYNQRITVYTETTPKYDPTTNQTIKQSTEKWILPCDYTDLGLDRQMALFGNFDRKRLVVRLQRPLSDEFNRAVIDGKTYIINSLRLSDKVLIVEAVANHA